MPLTTAQLQTLKADLAANASTVSINGATPVAISSLDTAPERTSDAAFSVAAWYNLAASPAFVLWRKQVSVPATGDAMNATEVGGLTTANLQRLQTLAQYTTGFFDFSLPDRRQAFNDIFSGAGGTNTRASLLALQKRSGTNAEKLFATGTGSDASPAISAFADGLPLTGTDIQNAWNS